MIAQQVRQLARTVLGQSGYERIRDLAKGRFVSTTERRQRFSGSFERNTWGSPESRSGTGSTLAETATLREVLPNLCRELAVRSVLDLPCGDFNWMRQVDLGDVAYTGADIVSALIETNRSRFGRADRQFIELDIVSAVPPAADLVLCRDLLVHLSYAEIAKALRNLKRSGATWLLTTTFTGLGTNENLLWKDWRPLNLEIPPFSFSQPERLIDEICSENDGRYRDKSLGLWRLSDLVFRG